MDQMQDGVLTGEDFRVLYDSLNAQLAETETELNAVRANGPELDVDTAFGYLSHLVWNQHIFYQDSDLEEKRRVARTIFPAGIRCSKDGFGTAVTHSLFSVLADESVSPEHLVALPGIEPGF
ncbi:MAG TPA: hypothetical protein VKB38_25015 [Terracidiphilus sp.]|nr:hypothetical protein [Terracidiphilus sp.]